MRGTSILVLVLVVSQVATAAIPNADATGQVDSTTAIQAAVDALPEGGTLSFDPGRYLVRGIVQLTRSITVDFNGATILLNGGYVERGFLLPATARCEFVEFRRGTLLGDGTLESNKGPVIGSFSGCEIGRFLIRDCTFRNLTYGCVFNCAAKGFIRQAILEDCLFENIVGNDENRGKGAAFGLNGAEFCCGRSSGNVFINCGRHSLYCSTGGRFLSEGDSFYRNNAGGETNYSLAAIQLARGPHMRVSNAYLEGCRDGIAVVSDKVAGDYFDVAISDCTFVNNERYDIVLNGDNPQEHGMYRDVVVRNTQHLLRARDNVAIAAWSFHDLRLNDIDIHDERDGTTRPSILITGIGDSRDVRLTGIRITTAGDPKRAIEVRQEALRLIRQRDVSILSPLPARNTR